MNEEVKIEEKIEWKVTKEPGYISFVNMKSMPIERAKVEGIQMLCELMLEHNKLLDHQNKLIEDSNSYMLSMNEKLKICVDEIGFIRGALVH